MTSRSQVRAWAVAGCVGLGATWMNVPMIPAAGVGLITGLLGIRQVGRDLAHASVRLGVSLIASGIVAVGSVITGHPAFIVPALLALGAFGMAWRRCDQLQTNERAAWGIEQRDRMRRLHSATQRHDQLRNGPRDRPDDRA